MTVLSRLGLAGGRRRGPAPPVPLRHPLAECRLALVAGSVCLAPGGRGSPGVQVGDPFFRTIAGDMSTAELQAVPTAELRDASTAHPAVSRGPSAASAANLDRNLAFALDRLREAVSDGRLGELNRRHLALCGVMAASGRAIRKRAPQAARWLTDDRVDVALLVPT